MWDFVMSQRWNESRFVLPLFVLPLFVLPLFVLPL